MARSQCRQRMGNGYLVEGLSVFGLGIGMVLQNRAIVQKCIVPAAVGAYQPSRRTSPYSAGVLQGKENCRNPTDPRDFRGEKRGMRLGEGAFFALTNESTRTAIAHAFFGASATQQMMMHGTRVELIPCR